jgi:hypothetical protein
MPDPDHQDHETIVLHPIHHTIVSKANSQDSLLAMEHRRSRRTGVFGQGTDCGIDAAEDLRRESGQSFLDRRFDDQAVDHSESQVFSGVPIRNFARLPEGPLGLLQVQAVLRLVHEAVE